MLHKIIPSSSYARNIATLITGTAFAQALPIAISPILTRLYTPNEFGLFAIYMAIASIMSILVTGRYDLAIILPKKDCDAIHITALSAILSLLISISLLIVIAFINKPLAILLKTPDLAFWLYWIPASTFLSGIYQSLNYWSNRKSQYKRLAISRTAQSGATSISQLVNGYLGAGTTGLIGGQITGQVISTALLARLIYRDDRDFIRSIRKKRILRLARKYINFPKFLIVAHGFNTASAQMPSLLLGMLFNSATAGFYTLTQRVMGAPVTLIAGAIGDVFRQEASYAYANEGNCREIYRRTFKKLLAIALFPFALFFFISPKVFSIIFGNEWAIAGEYAQILTPMFFLKFITSPLSSVYTFSQNQKIDLSWQITLFFLVCISLLIGSGNQDPRHAIIGFSLVYSAMYIVNGLVSYRLSSGHLKII